MKEIINVGISLEYDPAENGNVPGRIFLYRLLNDLDRKEAVKVRSVRFRGVERGIDEHGIRSIELREGEVLKGLKFKE